MGEPGRWTASGSLARGRCCGALQSETGSADVWPGQRRACRPPRAQTAEAWGGALAVRLLCSGPR
eukprot:12728674-Alexandrium_andersonii.AAC.1